MANVIRFVEDLEPTLPKPGTALLEAPTPRSHLVHFYESDELLYEAVARFIAGGLRSGERVVVIATAEHRRGFLRHLAEEQPERATRDGQLVFVDATEALGELLVGGEPDRARFRALFARILGPRGDARCVRAYGEMVDLLWKDGHEGAALRLEELWNEAAQETQFTLLCAYGLTSFYRGDGRAQVNAVCAQHTHVIPPEREAGPLDRPAHGLDGEPAQRERLEEALRAALVERQEARAEAEAERGRLAEVLKRAPVAVAVVRAPDRAIELANARCEELLGCPRLSGKKLVDVLPALASGEAARVLERVFGEGEPFTHDALRLPGADRFVALSVVAMRDVAGAIDRVIAVAVDVTNDVRRRRDAARESAASEERFKLLVASVKEYAIFMLDPQGYITTWNEGARRIKGYEAQEIVGRHFSCFYPPEKRGVCEHELAVAIEEGRFEEEGIRLRKDGSQFWANVVITPLRDERGALVGFAKVTRDLTEKRRTELQRKRLTEAQLASRAKDQFLASVSHELRTPLNAILGYAVLLAEHPLPAEVRRGLQVIERNARVQARLIEDVLDVSRIVSGTLRLNCQRSVLQEAVAAAIDTVRPGADAKGVVLAVEVPPAPIAIYADPERIQQIVWNLATNAVKFTPRGGRVEVRVHAEDGRVRLVVRDNGRGIAPDFLPFLFQPFQQADGTATRRSGGLGLGLSIVKHLVEAHGGSVEVMSEGEGRGSTFDVTLPLRAEAAERARAASPRAGAEERDAQRLDGVRVLVVDDDEDTRNLVAHVLGAAGAEVHSSASADEAMTAVTETRPDVLVSDIGMPEVDGYTLVRKLRALSHERGGRIPAVALTAYARPEDEQRAYGAGFQAYAAKPIDPAHLVMLVASLALVS